MRVTVATAPTKTAIASLTLGVCHVQPISGRAIDGPCTPEEFLTALDNDGDGSFNLTLPLGGFEFHRELAVKDGQKLILRANDNDATNPDVHARFKPVHGHLEIERIRVSGQRAGVVFMMGERTYALVDRCEFAGNDHDFGGAIAMINGELQIVGSLFEKNKDTNAGYGGGAIYCEAGTVTARDTIFRGNEALSR